MKKILTAQERATRVDKQDVVTHFKLRVDITLEVLHRLEEAGKVYASWVPVPLPHGTTYFTA